MVHYVLEGSIVLLEQPEIHFRVDPKPARYYPFLKSTISTAMGDTSVPHGTVL